MQILMVCLGNICRSPIADGLLRKKVKEKNVTFIIDSAGTSGFHQGDPPDERMIATATKNGTCIKDLRSRRFLKRDFESFDFIIAMDESNFEDLLEIAEKKEHKAKIHLLLGPITNQANGNVPDPYYGTMSDFQDVYEIVDKATDTLLEKLIFIQKTEPNQPI